MNTIKWGNSNVARTVWRFRLTACKVVFIFKEFSTDYSNAIFQQCRVVLVWCFSDHKCRHGVMFMRRGARSSLNATNALFILGFIVLVSSRLDTASQYGKWRNISVTHLRYLANQYALDSCPIRAHLASHKDELCKNLRVSERRSIEEQQ